MPRIWGGQALGSILNHSLPHDEPYGEAWDVCHLPESVSCVADGPCRGMTLDDLWTEYRKDLIADFKGDGGFPLLIKWLECRGWLSVQVHPDNQMARRVLRQTRGKSEVWIVLDADPGARILAGLRSGVTQATLVQHLNRGTVEDCLHTFTPRSGDCIVLPAGTIHSAGGGLLVAEVQQSSDATFRLFDWNRAGQDGRPRPLQVELALQAIDWNRGPVGPVQPQSIEILSKGGLGEALAALPDFSLDRFTISQSLVAPYVGEMTIWMVLDGLVRMTHVSTGDERNLSRGRTVLIPASAGKITWSPVGIDTRATLLCVRLPARA